MRKLLALLVSAPLALIGFSCPLSPQAVTQKQDHRAVYRAMIEQLAARDCGGAMVNAAELEAEAPAAYYREELPFYRCYCSFIGGSATDTVNLARAATAASNFMDDYALYFSAVSAASIGDAETEMEALQRLSAPESISAWSDWAAERLRDIYRENDRHDKLAAIYDKLAAGANTDAGRAVYKYQQAFHLRSAGELRQGQELARTVALEYPWTTYGGKAYALVNDAGGIKDFTIDEELRIAESLSEHGSQRAAARRADKLADKISRSNDSRRQGARADLLRAIASFDRRRYTDAIRRLKDIAASNLSPARNAKRLYYLGRSYARRDQLSEARRWYRKVVKKYPTAEVAEDAAFNIAIIAKLRNETDAAVAGFDDFIAKFPQSKRVDECRWKQAWVLYRAGEYERSMRYMGMLLSPEVSWKLREKSRYWIGRSLEQLKRKEEAIAAYKELLTEEPFSYHAVMTWPRLEKLAPGAVAPLVPLPEDLEFPSPGTDITNSVAAHWQRLTFWETMQAPDFIEREMTAILFEEPTDPHIALDLSRRFAVEQQYYFSQAVIWNGPIDKFWREDKRAWRPTIFRAAYPQIWPGLIDDEAAAAGIDPNLVRALIRHESLYQPAIVSWAGAVGLMQMMPATGRIVARELGMEDFETDQLTEPATNVKMGIHYLKGLLDDFDGNVFYSLAGYNAGPHRVTSWKAKKPDLELDEFLEDIPFDETRYYVKKVTRAFLRYSLTYPGRSEQRSRWLNIPPALEATVQ